METDSMSREELLRELKAMDKRLKECEEAYKSLAATEERYRNFVDNVDESCFESDITGKFIFVNDKTAANMGLAKEEILGNSYPDLIHPDDVDKVRRAYAEAYRACKPVKIVYRYRFTDGKMHIVEDSAYPIIDSSGKVAGFRGIGRDVTEQVERMRELERAKNFLDNVHDSCFEVDLEGKYLFFNDAACRLLGRTREEMSGMRSLDLFPADLRSKIFQFYNHIYRTGKSSSLGYDIVTKDGEVRHVQTSVSLIKDESGNILGFRGITRDVTEQRKREAELERYKNFIDHVDDSCIENDLSGRFIFFNEALCRSLGYSREEIPQLRFTDYMSPETAKNVFETYNRIYRTGESVKNFSFEVIDKTGRPQITEANLSLIRDEDGNPVGFRNINRTVTERVKREEELERYRSFFENIEDSIYELDLHGRFTLFNEATCRNTGYDAAELRKTDEKRFFVSEEQRQRATKMFIDLLTTKKPIKSFELPIKTKSGEIIYCDLMTSVITDSSGKPAGYRCISRDITERKKLELEQEQLKERLAQAEKLESIGTLAGGIAHDFNNLLMGIQGYTSLMLIDMNSSHQHYEMLKAIEAQVKSGADLTQQLLGYARGGRYVVTSTNISELMAKTIAVFSRTKKEIRVHERYAKSIWPVKCDQRQMEQVFLNLFVNAWQAMPGGGTLYLETSNVYLDDEYVNPFDCAPGSYVKISITDTGLGMDEKTRQRIFEPFFTTKEMGHGTGLGLASAYGIIKGHKGIINVYSEKGRGSTFTIYLPAEEFEEIKKTASPSPLADKGTILIVDDEKTNRDVTSALLKRLGYNVMVAQGGDEGVKIYESHVREIDLVIMDMIMPEVGGRQAIAQIRKINPGAKVILASGYSINGEAREILDEGGAQDFIQKPFYLEALSKKIDTLMKAEDILPIRKDDE